MEIISHTLSIENKIITLKLLKIENNDREILKKVFVLWEKINKDVKEKLYGARKLNMPEAISEAVVCLELGFHKFVSAHGSANYKTSFDCFDIKTNKRIQIKCSTSTGPSSFGPESIWDDIYFIDFYNSGTIDGNYKIYKIDSNYIYNAKMNKNQTLVDQQKEKRRPRFDIRKEIIEKHRLKPLKIGRL